MVPALAWIHSQTRRPVRGRLSDRIIVHVFFLDVLRMLVNLDVVTCATEHDRTLLCLTVICVRLLFI